VIPWPADRPGWYYPKKNIALGNAAIISGSLLFRSKWTFPYFCFSEHSRDTVIIFKHFFDKLLLFKTVFGTDLPHKPKPYKDTLCLTAALLGLAANLRKISAEIWNLQRP